MSVKSLLGDVAWTALTLVEATSGLGAAPGGQEPGVERRFHKATGNHQAVIGCQHVLTNQTRAASAAGLDADEIPELERKECCR